MATKRRLIASIIFASMLIIFSLNTSPQGNAIEQEEPQSSDGESILDKVFTFEIGGPILTFNDIILQEHYVYYVRVQLVTPHWCNATVRIYDPDGELFVVYNGTLFQEPFIQSWAEIPFGVAISGNHSFSFEIRSDNNINVYLRIEKADLCLRDKVAEWEPYNFLLYEVTRFNEDQESIIHEIIFRSDYKYGFYLGRVSAEGNLNTVDFMDLTVSDPDDLPFSIYEGVSVAGIADIDDFTYGASQSGTYTMNLEISLDERHENINIAYLIVNKGVIASGFNGSTNNNTEIEGTKYYVPFEAFFISGGLIGGGLIFIAISVSIKNRKIQQASKK